MKCPHCGKAGKKLVVESRPHDGNVYRRRVCGHCGKTFVTEEVARPGMPLPRASGPARMKEKHGAKDPGVVRGDGSHLQGIW